MYLISKQAAGSYDDEEHGNVSVAVMSELYLAGYGVEILEVELIGV